MSKRLKDLQFVQICSFDIHSPIADKSGHVKEWAARNPWGNSIAFGSTKKECIADARA